ncbi:MAG: hypothetical protein QOJ00_2480 [Actinomycetota bacterium]
MDPATDGVVTAREEVRVVRVQTLHTVSGTPDASARTRTAAVNGNRRVAFDAVTLVSGRECVGIDVGFRRAHATAALELAHSPVRVRPDQPVSGGHRRAVIEKRRVADHNRGAGVVAHHNVEIARGDAAE